MTKSYQDEQDFIYTGKIACKCAFTFGGKQHPVLSNIIDTSPLFYVDTGYDFDFDDEFLELEDLRAELNEGATREDLREKKHRLEQAGKHLSGYEKRPTHDLFLKNAADITSNKPRVQADLEACLDILRQSKLGENLLSVAQGFGVEVTSSAHVFNVLYDRAEKIIRVQKNIDHTRAVFGLVKALRQVWMHQKGYLIQPLCFQPEDAILLNRLHIADTLSVQCRVAWEVKLAGNTNLWEELMGGAGYDLATSLAREAISDFRALTNGKANRASFETWFLSGRCKVADKELIQQMLADQHGLVFNSRDISRSASFEIIAGLGEMPYGKNYLSSLTAQIAEDPLYAEIRDRSNANFLWFIKFERSFRESEQELQKHNGPTGGTSRSSQTPAKDHAYEGNNSQVITFRPLPAERAEKPTARLANDGANDENVATIYYLEHFQQLPLQRNT